MGCTFFKLNFCAIHAISSTSFWVGLLWFSALHIWFDVKVLYVSIRRFESHKSPNLYKFEFSSSTTLSSLLIIHASHAKQEG